MSKIVAKKVLLNQTSLIAGDTIFTSSEGGDFIVHVYGEGKSTSVGSGNTQILLSWTDEIQVGAYGWPVGNWGSVNDFSYGQPNVIHMLPNSSLILSTTGTAPPAGSFYNIFVSVQELSAPGL